MMKELMIMICVITVILLIIFFPQHESYTFISHEEEEMYTYTITLEGAIVHPGDYVFYEPLSLEEILKLSTFLCDDADLEKINLKQIYDANYSIYIPSKDDDAPVYKKININEANFQLLLEIPGIQERQAASIIIYREANGLFSSLEELLNVKYIGAATLENIQPYITT